MDDWFARMAAGGLSARAAQELHDVGFAVIPGPVPPGGLALLAEAYDAAVASAGAADVRVGSTTTRVVDFVNRGPAFDGLYVYPPALEAAWCTIGQPFRLSTMHARTLRPRMPAQELHVDFPREGDGWPMVGFILMVDEFRPDNGATRFLPGSHRWITVPADLEHERVANYEGQVLACGPAGSLIVFNGSVWHGHTANASADSRRSIQGAYILREAKSGSDLPARMQPETLARISPLAKYVLAVQHPVAAGGEAPSSP